MIKREKNWRSFFPNKLVGEGNSMHLQYILLRICKNLWLKKERWFFFYLWQMLRSSFRHAEEQWVFCHLVYVNVYSFFGYPLKHVLYNKTECRIPFILRHWEMVPLIPMSLTPFSWYIPQPFLQFGRVT